MVCSLADMLRKNPMAAVDVTAINLDDRTFAISTFRDQKALANSLQFAGLLHPVWLQKIGDIYQIVSGFQRVAAAQTLDWQDIPALILPENVPDLALAQLAILDNKNVRELNMVEEARAVALLKSQAQDEKDFRQALQNCEFTLNPKHLIKLERLILLPEDTLDAVARDIIPLTVADGLAAFDAIVAQKFTEIFVTGKVGLNRQREFIRLVYELSKIRDLQPGDVFCLDEFTAVWQSTESDQRRKALLLLEWLYNTRYPNIAKAREQAREKIASMGIDNRIRLNMPENFENLRHSLSFSFESRCELVELLELCRQMADHENLAALFLRDK